MTRLFHHFIIAQMLVGLLLTPRSLPATLADESVIPESETEAQGRVAYGRFLTLLRKQPRPGTALDRVYAFHVEQGTLDEFTSSLTDEASSGDADGAASMLLGLVELQRGRDSEAAAALRIAETKRPDDSYAAWFHGRALVRLGQADTASAAFERAIQRSPARADLLQIYQELGRAHRRSRQPQKAADVWKRMEEQFPNDVRVKEQIAAIQYEEGDFEAALTRYEDLAKKHTDPYQAATCAMTAGELKLKLGRTEEALTDFERQLAMLDPESWLYRDARRRIEDVFLRTDDLAGLVVYYETWLTKHPEDLDAMSRVGRALAQQGRLEDARAWYAKALERAPSDIALREAMIAHLIREENYVDAIAQYEQLHRFDSSNADHVEEWGLLWLNRRDLPQDERRAKAAEVWQTLLTDRQNDPVTISRVADLLRRAEMADQAIELYQKAIALAPNEPQYREYLGEYFHELKRTDKALAIWNSMADGELQTTDNLVRLSEVLWRYQYREEALSAMQAACELTPTFAQRIRYARLLRDFDPNVPRRSASEIAPDAELRGTLALQQLDIAEAISESADERDLVLDERIRTLIATAQLQQETQELAADLAADTNATADRWRTLSQYYAAGSQMPLAIEAITRSLTVDAESVASWTVAADLYEKTGRNGDAAEANRRLAMLDRRFLTEYLKKIATLEQKLGRLKQAQQAGKDLLAAAPGNPEHFQFYANLCFQLGQKEEGLNTLRRSVRANPSDENAVLALARALSDQSETAESIELYWRAFDQASDVDARSGIVTSLAELHLRTNQFDRLLQKLELRGKELNQQRDIAICLAAAFRAAGDMHSARQKLESLLAADSRDVSLLAELSRMAEDEDDLEAAADYQRRINIITSSDDGRSRLAGILLKLGEVSEAESLWVRASESESDPLDLFRSIDHLIDIDSTDAARKLCERIVQRDPENWEALVRLGTLDWHSGLKDEAMKSFNAIVALKKNPNTPSAEAAKRSVDGTAAASTPNTWYVSWHGSNAYPTFLVGSGFPPALRRRMRAGALITLLMEQSENATTAAMYNAMYSGHPQGYFGSGSSSTMPEDFGEGRIVGLAAQFQYAKGTGTETAFMEDLNRRAEKDIQAAWDVYQLRNANHVASIEVITLEQSLDLAEKLARSGDSEGRSLFLSLSAENVTIAEIPETNYVMSAEFDLFGNDGNFLSGEGHASKVPVSAERLLLLLESFEIVVADHPEWLQGNEQFCVLAECNDNNRLDLVTALARRLVQEGCNTAQLTAGLQLSLSLRLLDNAAVLKLMSRIDASKDAGSATPAGYSGFMPPFPHDAVAILATRSVQAKDWPALRTTLTWFLDYKVRQTGHQANTPAVPGAGTGFGSSAFNFAGSGNDVEDVHYPEFGRNFDEGDSRLLAQICAGMIIAAGEREQLAVWYEEQKPLSSSTRALYLELIESGVAWWDGSQAEAIVHLIRAVELAPGDIHLRIKLIELCEHVGQHAEALALLDQLPENDPVLLKARELKALDLAFRTNNEDRARQAAERLYGLQLDVQSTVMLIARLKKLGMREMAEEVESRTKKNDAARNTSSPLQLLEQYEKQGNTAAAVQIAQQLLRRTSAFATAVHSRYGNRQTDPEAIRNRAFEVLKKSGELKNLINRQRVQLEKSPNSKVLLTTLIEHLRADGQSSEMVAMQQRLLALQPQNSATTILNAAQQLNESGQSSAACDKYLQLLRKHSVDFATALAGPHVSDGICALFKGENRTQELADAVIRTGLTNFRHNPEFVSALIGELLKQPESRATAAALLSNVIVALPEHRTSILADVKPVSQWQTPELFPVLSRLFVPSSTAEVATPTFEWCADYNLRYLNLDAIGQSPGGLLEMLCVALESEDCRAIFDRNVTAAQRQFPQWPAGDVLLAMAAVETDRPDEVRRLLKQFVDDDSRVLPEENAFAVASQLVMSSNEFSMEAIELLEKTLLRDNSGDVDFGKGAALLLRRLYVETEQSERGRRVLRERCGFFSLDHGSMVLRRPDGARSATARYTTAAAFIELGEPITAIALLKDFTAADEQQSTLRWNPPMPRVMDRLGNDSPIRTIRQEATEAITVVILTEELNHPASLELSAGQPRIDLLPQLKDSTAPAMTFECATITAMTPGKLMRAEQRADLMSLAEALNAAMKRKDVDSSLIILGVYKILTSQDEASVAAISTSLDAFLRRPVQPREDSGGFSAEHVTMQDSEIAFGFVAMKIEKQPSLEPLAELMTARALAIARQWPDKRYLSALLYNQGTTLQAARDKVTAEESWSELLDVLLAEPEEFSPLMSVQPPSNVTRPGINIGEELRKNLLRDKSVIP